MLKYIKNVFRGPISKKADTLRLLLIKEKLNIGGIPVGQIGTASQYGIVFNIHTKNGTRKVVKLMKGGTGKSEYSIQKIAANRGLAPKVYKFIEHVPLTSNNQTKLALKSQTINMIVMNNLVQNNKNKVIAFGEYIKNVRVPIDKKRQALQKLKNSVAKLDTIEHGNLHKENVYVIIKPDGSVDIKIIDFGSSIMNKSIIKKLRPASKQELKQLGNVYGPGDIFSLKNKWIVLNSFHLKIFEEIINSFNKKAKAVPVAKAVSVALKKCPKGSRRDKKTGQCVSTGGVVPAAKAVPAALKRCPKGSRRDKKTGQCVSTGGVVPAAKAVSVAKAVPAALKKCPKGSRRDKKTGQCTVY